MARFNPHYIKPEPKPNKQKLRSSWTQPPKLIEPNKPTSGPRAPKPLAPIGFHEARDILIEGLRAHRIKCLPRPGYKNILLTGHAKVEDLIEVVVRANGSNYASQRHNQLVVEGGQRRGQSVELHEISGIRWGDRVWYIKWYCWRGLWCWFRFIERQSK